MSTPNRNEENMTTQVKRNEISVDTINKWAVMAKYAWSLLIGTFLLGAAANFQMLSAKFENEKRDAKIAMIESKVETFWNTAMLGDLTVYTHSSNRVALMHEDDLRKLVDDIYKRYNR